MNRQWRLLPVIGVVFFLAASTDGQDAKQEPPATSSPNYYPMDVGNEWHYRVTGNNKSSSVVTRIAKIDDINGEKLARLESPNVNITEHLTQFGALEVPRPEYLLRLERALTRPADFYRMPSHTPGEQVLRAIETG